MDSSLLYLRFSRANKCIIVHNVVSYYSLFTCFKLSSDFINPRKKSMGWRLTGIVGQNTVGYLYGQSKLGSLHLANFWHIVNKKGFAQFCWFFLKTYLCFSCIQIRNISQKSGDLKNDLNKIAPKTLFIRAFHKKILLLLISELYEFAKMHTKEVYIEPIDLNTNSFMFHLINLNIIHKQNQPYIYSCF